MTEKQKLNLDFEKAIRMLSKFMPEPKEDSRKPVLFHDIRVGVYLYENGYSSDIVLSGVLHDALEFSEISEEMLRVDFGEKILEIVKANSKDRTIEDSDKRIEENIQRCAKSGEEALIVKTADIVDSFKHYTATQNENELEYCRKTMKMIKKHKPENFNDPIFKKIYDNREFTK